MKFLQVEKYNNAQPIQKHFRHDLLSCAALPNQSVKFFESHEFIKMIGRLDPKIHIPSRRTLTQSIIAEAELYKQKV